MRFHDTTPAQFRARVREEYRAATGQMALKLGAQIATWTASEIASAFNVSAGQASSIKARAATHGQTLATVRAAVGE